MSIENALHELLTQREQLEQKIKKIQSVDREEALKKIKTLVDLYGFSAQDIFEIVKIKVKPKYRNPKTGQVWSGRGKTPLWLVGQDKEDFEIVA